MARASLDELLLDYEDYLRQKGHRQWSKADTEARRVRDIGRKLGQRPADQSDRTDQTDSAVYARWLNHPDPAVQANTILCLIHQTNYLLDQHISRLERDFVHVGGYSEQLAAERMAERERQRLGFAAQTVIPACPQCGKAMALRTAHKGPRTGTRFWGCVGYPGCKGTRTLDLSDRSV